MEILDSVDFSPNRGVITFPLLDAELNLRVETLTDVENSANIIRKIKKDDLARVLTILDVATPSYLLETNEEYVSVAYLVEAVTQTNIYPDTLKGIFVSSLSNVGLAPLIDEVVEGKETFLVELFTRLLKQGVGSYSMVGVDDTISYNEEEALRLEQSNG